jgi:3-hydroxyisobutyrate dehydrogenase-like beta-hydroxyacid dehydrogenase
MGAPMAGNLLTAGYRVQVYNRTPDKAAPLIARGAVLMSDAMYVAGPGGIVVTMLADDEAVEVVVLGERGILKQLGPNGIHVSMSTISPATARRLADHHARHRVAYVAAPVFGRPDAAAARKLWICVSGREAARMRVQPIVAALGQGVFEFGEDPGAAHVAKLAGNFLLASAIEALAEALTLAEKNGIDRSALVTMLGQTLFACPAYQNYGPAIAEDRFQPPGFTVSLGLKDVNLVLRTAADSATPMPLASLLHDRFLATVAQGLGGIDWAGVAVDVAKNAGLTRASSS